MFRNQNVVSFPPLVVLSPLERLREMRGLNCSDRFELEAQVANNATIPHVRENKTT
jgi:hypothetical protein